jgi:hypothetical protein
MRNATPAGLVSATLLLAICWVSSRFQPTYRDDYGEGLFAMHPDLAALLLPEGDGRIPELFHAETAIFVAGRYLTLLLKVCRFEAMWTLLAFRYGLGAVADEGEALLDDPDNIRYVTDILKTMAWLWKHKPGRLATTVDPHHRVYPN